MHPGQFTVLASDNADIVDRSIEEFEYHTNVIRYMGYGRQFQDFKCNVHISGRNGPACIKAALKRLSPEARNVITIENDENKWGLDSSLELADERDCRTVAVPAIGAGVAGFPMQRCAEVLIEEARRHLDGETGIEEIRFVLFGEPAYRVFEMVHDAAKVAAQMARIQRLKQERG